MGAHTDDFSAPVGPIMMMTPRLQLCAARRFSPSMGSSMSKSHSASPSSPGPLDLSSSTTSPPLTQQPTYAAHSLLLSVSRSLPRPSLTSKPLVVSISKKVVGAVESSLRPSKYSNDLYHRKNNSIPRREVIHIDIKAYQNALEVIMRNNIRHETVMVDYHKDEIDGLGPRTTTPW